MSGHDTGKIAISIHHRIDEKTRIDQSSSFTHIVIQTVMIDQSCARFLADTGTDFVCQRQRMVFLDRFVTSYAGKDTFTAAAKAGHQMYCDAAGNNYFVGISNMLVDPDRRTTTGITNMHQIICQTVMLIDLNPVSNFLSADSDILCSGLSAMCTLCYNDANILIRYTA